MQTLIHKNNEYHIIEQFGTLTQSTTAYRVADMGYIEILRKWSYPTLPFDDQITVIQLTSEALEGMLSHREHEREIEAREVQEEYNHSYKEAVGV